MNTQRQVRRLNKTLRDELGDNPIYAWIWSEDLVTGVFAGTEPYADPHTGLIRLRPIYKPRKTLHTVDHQWLLCFKSPPPSYDNWLRQFGWQLEWPSNGQWVPVTTQPGINADGKPVGGLAALDRGETPGETVTRQAIGMIRQNRKKTRADLVAEIEAAQDAGLKRRDALVEDMVRDALPAFGGGTPGGKQHWEQGGLGPNLHERKEVIA